MYLKRLKNREADDSWSIVGVCNSREECQVDFFLSGLGANLVKDVTKVRALFTHIAKNGPQHLPVERSHNIAPEIFEFICGRLRIAWFYGVGGKIVVCSNGFVKDSQKTRRADIEAAQRARNNYLAAHAEGGVAIIDAE
jgi:hypothetical protein